MEYSEKRPRPKGVTRKKANKVTSKQNIKNRRPEHGRPKLLDGDNNKRKGLRDVRKKQDIISLWPKIVEYIGLSEYESKVYLSLINLGTAGARKLSINCDVPRTKVYGTLKKLIDYGLVVEIPGAPKKFSPSKPKDCFNTILNITKEKADDFCDIIENLENLYTEHSEQGGPRKKLVWYLDPEEDIRGKCSELIRQSEHELNIITTDDGLEILFNSYHRLLDEMQEHGVEIKLHSPLDPKVNPLARELSYIFQIQKVNVKTPILFINSDNKRFLIARLATRGKQQPFLCAMFTEDKELLELIHLLLLNNQNKILLQAFPLS